MTLLRHSFPTGQGGGRYAPLRKEGMREACSRCGAERVWHVKIRRWMYVRTVDGTVMEFKHVVPCDGVPFVRDMGTLPVRETSVSRSVLATLERLDQQHLKGASLAQQKTYERAMVAAAPDLIAVARAAERLMTSLDAVGHASSEDEMDDDEILEAAAQALAGPDANTLRDALAKLRRIS